MSKRFVVFWASGLAGFFLIAFPNLSFAAITFSPGSPQVWSDGTTASCDTGNHLDLFAPDGSAQAEGPDCSPSVFYGADGNYGDYTFVECDDTVLLSNCPSFATLADAEADPGFVSETAFEFDPASYVAAATTTNFSWTCSTDPSTSIETCISNGVTYYDLLIFGMVYLFITSIPMWLFFFQRFHPLKQGDIW